MNTIVSRRTAMISLAATIPALALIPGNVGLAHAADQLIPDDKQHPAPLAVASDLTIGGRVVDVELWTASDFEKARAEGFDPAVEDGAEWSAIEMGPFVVVLQLIPSHEAVERLVEDGRDFGDALRSVAGIARNDRAWDSFVPAAG